jgi:hypothetical protein
MWNVLAAAALIASNLVPPPGFSVEVLSVSGEGCPPKTTQVAPSPDRQAFTVTYSDFLVQGKGSEAKKKCELEIRVNHPADHTYAVEATDHRGFAHLDAGTTGTKKASYHFVGHGPTRHISNDYAGPYDDNWQATDKPDPGKLTHGPCKQKKPLRIVTELRIKGKSGFMSMDSTDSSVSARFQLNWKKC